jgi:penicillin-binding protein 1A
MMLDLMWGVVDHGTGRAAKLSVPAFGKTGTTQEYRDALFVGLAGDLVVGVWVGNDDGTPMKRVTGGGLPAQIWRDFMVEALRMAPPRATGLPRERRPMRMPDAPAPVDPYAGGYEEVPYEEDYADGEPLPEAVDGEAGPPPEFVEDVPVEPPPEVIEPRVPEPPPEPEPEPAPEDEDGGEGGPAPSRVTPA